MRIGILTFHAAHNYGAVLQCYALQTFLQSKGDDVSVIDYRNPKLLDFYKCFRKERFLRKNLLLMVWNLCRELYYYRRRKQRYDSFTHFIETQLKLVGVDTIENNPFDVIIVGSDQVWNTRLTRGFDQYYWGEFKRPPKTRLVTYAASMQDNWPKEQDGIIAEKLQNFYKISVREVSLAQKLHGLTGLCIQNVVDPTLLLSPDDWERIAVKPQVPNHYLLLYQVDNSSRNEEIAQNVAAKYSLPIVHLSADVVKDNSSSVCSASPAEFVGLFLYADFVICSSFHGTVFSLLFEKKFYSVRLEKNKNARVESLLSQLGLIDRFISEYNDRDDSYILDKVKFADMISKSIVFLNQVAKNEEINN